MKINDDTELLVLRTTGPDLKDANGFQWPDIGYVEAPEWCPCPHEDCRKSLHGLAKGLGDHHLLEGANFHGTVWQIVRVQEADCAPNREKNVRFRCGEVVYSGGRDGCMGIMRETYPTLPIHYMVATGGDGETVIGGNYSVLSGGNKSTVRGGHYSFVRGGDDSIVSAGAASIVVGGNRSHVSGLVDSHLIGGNGSVIRGENAATAQGGKESDVDGGKGCDARGGYRSIVRCGDGGSAHGDVGSAVQGGERSILSLCFWNRFPPCHHEIISRVVGHGVTPYVPYQLDDNGRFVMAPVGRE